MEEKELNEILEKVGKEVNQTLKKSAKEGDLKSLIATEIEAATAGIVKTDELGAKLEAVGIKDETIKELNDAIEAQGLKMQELLQKQMSNSKADPLEKALEERKDDILAIKQKGGKIELNVKQRANKTLVVRGAVASSTDAMRLAGIGQLPHLRPAIADLFRTVTGNFPGGVIRYVDQNAITRNADMVSEGDQKPESVINWIERSLTLEKIADSIPVSKEAWNDFDFVESEIRRLLDTNLMLKEDQQFWAGTGVSPEIDGVFTQAAEFVATPYIGTTTFDNIYDLISFMKVDIMNGKQSKYIPNIAAMNPADTLRYKLLKASDGHYLTPPFATENGTVIDGVRVIESSQVTANTMLVGDFNYGTRYLMEDMSIEMGHVNDQFIKNTFTILAEKREALLIRNVDVDAFQKVSNITTALNTLIPSV